MKLNHRQQSNGLFILGRSEIDQIATDVLREVAPQNLISPLALRTDALFDQYGLMVKHAFLGVPGHEILGATVMGDSAEVVVCDILNVY